MYDPVAGSRLEASGGHPRNNENKWWKIQAHMMDFRTGYKETIYVRRPEFYLSSSVSIVRFVVYHRH